MQANLSSEDMVEMFFGPLAKIYELLLDQINQARQNKSVKLKVSRELMSGCNVCVPLTAGSTSSWLAVSLCPRTCSIRSKLSPRARVSRSFVLLLRKSR